MIIVGSAMIPRVLLLAICFAWMAYESHFSPNFFFRTVRTSIVDIQAGIDDAMRRDGGPRWHTASTQ